MGQVKTFEILVKTDKATENIEGLTKEFDDFSKSVIKASENTSESVKGVEKASESSVGGVKKLTSFVKKSIIGVIIVAFAALREMVKENQKAVDFFNTAFEVGAIVISDLINFLSNNYDKAVGFFKDVFEKPSEYVSKLGDLIKENLIERFNSALEVVGHLADAFKNFFSGDFNAALESVKKAGVESLDVLSGIDNSLEKFTEGTKELAKQVEAYGANVLDVAKSNVELQKQSELALIKNQGLIEQYDRMAEQQRQIRDNETLSIEERIKANDELGRVLDEQEKLMKANAAIALSAAKIQYDRDRNNVEAKKAYLEALNEQAAIEAQVEGFRSEQQTNEKALQRELIELTKSRKEANEDLALSQKVFDAERIKDEVKRQEALNEIYAQEDAAKLARLESDIKLYNDGTQAKVDAEIAFEQFKEEARQREIENEEKLQAAKDAVELKSIETKKANAEQFEQIEADKRAAQMQTLDQAISIANEESALGKALLVAKQILAAREAIIEAQASARKAAQAVADAGVKAAGAGVDLSTGAAKAASAAPPPLNVPLIIAYAAQAVGIIASIRAATSKMKSAVPSGGGISIGAPSVPQATVPQVNTVGSSGVNQLASVVESSMNRPIKAFVVSKDVSTAQEMDRNIISQAGI